MYVVAANAQTFVRHIHYVIVCYPLCAGGDDVQEEPEAAQPVPVQRA